MKANMIKVFIVVECKAYDGDTILRVFNRYDDAIAYGERLLFDGIVNEYDVYEREVY